MNAARALGVANQIGSIASGKLADLTAVAMPASNDEPMAAAVFGSAPVIFTMIGGIAHE